MLEFTTTDTEDDAVEREQEELFSLNGVVYTIPTTLHPSEFHAYIYVRRTEGPDAAVSWAWQNFVSLNGYQALINAGDAVSEEDWIRMTEVITGRLVGRDVAVPGPKAAARSESTDSASGNGSSPKPARAASKARRTAPRR